MLALPLQLSVSERTFEETTGSLRNRNDEDTENNAQNKFVT